MVNIIKNVPTPSREIVIAFSEQSSATVHEAMGRRGAMDASIKPIFSEMKVCGPALTVRCHAGDNLMLVKAVSIAKPGDVIVADMGRIINSGPFGEILALECVTKGVAGLIVTGSVRDSLEIKKLGFPVFSSNISIVGTAKATLGMINHPITCGDEIVRPGDIILGDNDGVVVIPIEEAEEVLEKTRQRVEKENRIMNEIKSGKSAFDIYGYQKVFDKLGCVEEK